MPTSIKPVSTKTPPKKGRFRPRPKQHGLEPLQQSQIAKDIENASQEVSDRQQFCEEILAQGYIQTFVDFFYLTHRPEPPPNGTEETAGSGDDSQINVSLEEMSEIRLYLTKAEDSRRKGNTTEVFNAYASIAKHYKTNDPKTAIYYHEKCLEIARVTQNMEQEMAASHEIGLIYQSLNDANSAVTYHERHLEIAMENDEAETHMAARELVQVYMKSAEEHADDSNQEDGPTTALRLYEKCFEAAMLSGSRELQGMAGYRLGSAHLRAGEPEKARNFLQECLKIHQELEDRASEGQALAAMAVVCQMTNSDLEGAEYLKRCLTIAADLNDLVAQGETNCALGVIYNKNGQYDDAVDSFERNFEIARSMLSVGLGDVRHVDLSRVYLGMAKGNRMMKRYMHVVDVDLENLLNWKMRRILESTPTAAKTDP